MALYAFIGSFLLTLAFILREVQASRDRALLIEGYEHLRVAHNATRRKLVELGDHVAVLQALLYDRKHISQKDFLKARAQWDQMQKGIFHPHPPSAGSKKVSPNLRLVHVLEEEISSTPG